MSTRPPNPWPEHFEQRALAFLEAYEGLHTGGEIGAKRCTLARRIISTYERGGLGAAASLVAMLRKEYEEALGAAPCLFVDLP